MCPQITPISDGFYRVSGARIDPTTGRYVIPEPPHDAADVEPVFNAPVKLRPDHERPKP